MSNLVIYFSSLGILLYQAGCLKMALTPMTGSIQNRHSRWTTPGLGPMFHGGHFHSRPPMKPAGHETTTKTVANVGKHNIDQPTTEKGLQNRHDQWMNRNGTDIFVITTENQISENKTKLSHNKLWTSPGWTERPKALYPVCSPESCQTRGLQTPSCSNEKCGDINRTCNCDILCVIFGDCCSDVLHIIPKQAVHRMLYYPFDWKRWFQDVDSFHLVSAYIEWSTCMSIRNGSNPIAIRVIAKCPERDIAVDIPIKYSRLSALCEGSPHIPFVTKNVTLENKINHILFKNKYCARCHGFTKSHVVSPKTIFHHTLGARYFQSLVTGLLRRCDFTAQSQNQKLVCRQDYVSHMYNLKTFCSLNIFPVDFDIRDAFNSSRCFYCNGTERVGDCDTVHFSQRDHTLGIQNKPGMQEGGYEIDSFFSFYNYPHVRTPSKHTTIQHYVYHNVTGYPFVQCPLGFTKTGYTCNKQPNSQNDTFVLHITVTVKSGSRANNISVLRNLFTLDLLKFTLLDRSYKNGRFENVYQVHFNDQNLFLRLMYAAKEIFRNTDTEMIIATIDETGKLVNCHANQTDVMLFDVALTTTNSSIYVTNDRSAYLIPFPFAQFTLNIDIHNNDSNTSELTLSYCSSDLTVLMNCSAVRVLPPGRFSVHNETARRYDVDRNVTEDVRHYTIINHTLWVCEVNKPFIADYSYLTKLGQYISNITMSLSIVALFLLVYYHFIIPRLLNLHGKIVIGFAVSLATSQLIHVINAVMVAAKDYIETFTISNYVCKVLGIVGHYLLICSFLWCAIMSFDICRRFSACSSLHQQIDADKGRCRFRIYSSIATLLPFVIVLISNLVAILSADFDLGYGDNLHCMIYTYEGKLYAFDIPVLSIYAFSIVCFIVSLHGLECARRAGKHLYHTRKRDRRHLIAYSKITLMIGVSWLISIAGVFTRSVWVSFLGQFINGLQGLQVFIGFLFNDQIRKVILARYCCPIRTTNDNYAVPSHTDR